MDALTADFHCVGTSSADPFRANKRWEHVAYRVTLHYQGRTMETPFYVGMAHGDPTAADVLYSLLSDASSADNAETFEDYATQFVSLDSLGYLDAEEYRATFNAIKTQTVELRTLLGDDYDAAVFPNDEDHEEVAARMTQ